MKNKVTIISDPRDIYPLNRLLHSKYVNNIVNGQGLLKLNVSIEEQKKAIISSLKEGNAVWFGCDVGTYSSTKLGIMDANLYSTDLTLCPILEYSKNKNLN